MSIFQTTPFKKTYSSNASFPIKLTGLKNGTIYYVRVRGYSNSDGTRYNGTWRNTKKIQIK